MDEEGELKTLSEEDEENTPLNHANGNGKHANFSHSRTPSNGMDYSDMSEMDSPIISTKSSRKPRRVGMLGVKNPPNVKENGDNLQLLVTLEHFLNFLYEIK